MPFENAYADLADRYWRFTGMTSAYEPAACDPQTAKRDIWCAPVTAGLHFFEAVSRLLDRSGF